MKKQKMHTPDNSAENIEKLAALFPGCVTEARDEHGQLKKAIDFDQLRQELSGRIVEGPQERYRLDWPGKREALLLSNAPTAKTIRPNRSGSADFDSTKNIFIDGDNLDALKLLQETYLGKVKLIYIDPPYNTGNDFIYDDDFAESSEAYLERSTQVDSSGNKLVANTESNGRFHSDWLSMMYPRLRLARNLLKDNGSIFISIDDNEGARLRAICDEVFGANNFVANIIWHKVFAPKNSAKWFSEDHDHILVYARDKESWKPNSLPQTQEMIDRYTNPDNDPRGPWQSDNLTARNRYDAGLYSVKCPSGRVIDGPPRGRYWGINKDNFRRLDLDKRIWWGDDGSNMPRLKRFLSEVKEGRTPQTIWSWKEVGHTQDAKKELLKYVAFENTENVLNSVKPTSLIQRILTLATNANDNDIVLDFFGGSGSTAHAVLKQNASDNGNRKVITVQVEEPLPAPESSLKTILDIATTRVRTYAEEQRSNEPLSKRDLGFRMLKIDTSNMNDVYYAPDAVKQDDLVAHADNIKKDRTPEDLLFQVLVDWGVDLSLPIEQKKIAGKTVFFVDTNALVACFDPKISEALVKDLAKHKPLRAIFRDSSYDSDSTKINVEQIFKLLSPETEVKSL